MTTKTPQQNQSTAPHSRWHVGKEVPIAVVLAFVLQTFGVGWFMAQLSGKVDNLISTTAAFASERYTREDARRDLALYDQKIASAVAERNGKLAVVDANIDSLARRLEGLERPRR